MEGEEKESYFEGVPSIVTPDDDNYYCDACGREIRGCCRCPEPDYCHECYEYYKDYIEPFSKHTSKMGWAFQGQFINPCTGALGPNYMY